MSGTHGDYYDDPRWLANPYHPAEDREIPEPAPNTLRSKIRYHVPIGVPPRVFCEACSDLQPLGRMVRFEHCPVNGPSAERVTRFALPQPWRTFWSDCRLAFRVLRRNRAIRRDLQKGC